MRSRHSRWLDRACFVVLFLFAAAASPLAAPTPFFPSPVFRPPLVSPSSKPTPLRPRLVVAPSLALPSPPPGGVYDQSRKMYRPLPLLSSSPSRWSLIAASVFTKQQASRALVAKALWAMTIVVFTGFLFAFVSLLLAKRRESQTDDKWSREDEMREQILSIDGEILVREDAWDSGLSREVLLLRPPAPPFGIRYRFRGKPCALTIAGSRGRVVAQLHTLDPQTEAWELDTEIPLEMAFSFVGMVRRFFEEGVR